MNWHIITMWIKSFCLGQEPEFDLVNLDGSVQEELRTVIEKEGKILYEKI